MKFVVTTLVQQLATARWFFIKKKKACPVQVLTNRQAAVFVATCANTWFDIVLPPKCLHAHHQYEIHAINKLKESERSPSASVLVWFIRGVAWAMSKIACSVHAPHPNPLYFVVIVPFL